MIDFAHLIAPLDAGTFFQQYWEREALYILRNEPAYYKGLLTVADIDRYIFGNHNLALTPFRFFRGRDEARPPLSNGPYPYVVDHDQVFGLLEQGYGMYLNFPERIIPSLGMFCLELSAALKVQALSHLIISPPNVPGFLPHTDPYGVFVLQIAGEKTWFLYDVPEQPASASGRNFHHYSDRQPAQTVSVQPGDLLYLPRGMVHAVATTQKHSVHLSLALVPPTGSDLARLLLQSLAELPLLRDYVPFGMENDTTGQDAYAQLFKQQFMEAIAHVDLFALLEGAHQATIQNGLAVPSLRHLLSLDQLSETTLVRIKPGLAYQLIARSDRCVLSFQDQRLEFPAAWQQSLEELFARSDCRIGEIGRALPITNADRVQVARNLLKGGFLETSDDV